MVKRKRQKLTRTQRVLRSDGALCVTFANIGVGGREPLASYADLLVWGVDYGALADAEAERLERDAMERPGKAAAVYRQALALKARLRRILLALAVGEEPAATDFEAFNAALRAALAARELFPTLGAYRWSWGDAEDDLDRMLWPVLSAAGDLLVCEDRRRVRRCQRPDCDLLFIARSGGQPRKWCGRACRDRMNSNAHYHQVIKPRKQRHQRAADARQRAGLAGYGESWTPSAEPENE